MSLIRSFFIIVLISVSLALSSYVLADSPTAPLRIAVAANFAPVLEKILPQFTLQHQIKVQIISGATGTLFLQIKHGAPFDVFLSADNVRPEKLQQEGLTVKASRQTYAYGQLALWSTKGQISLEQFAAAVNNQRLAIANPNTAPYGKAAKETLENLKIWQQLQNKLVTGININQTFQQVRSKAVRVGIVANSQLVLNKLTGTVIPSHYHQAIEQQLVILKSSKQQQHAEEFSRFLLSDNVQQQIQRLGYANNNAEPLK